MLVPAVVVVVGEAVVNWSSSVLAAKMDRPCDSSWHMAVMLVSGMVPSSLANCPAAVGRMELVDLSSDGDTSWIGATVTTNQEN